MRKLYLKSLFFVFALILLAVVFYTAKSVRRTSTTENPQPGVQARYDREMPDESASGGTASEPVDTAQSGSDVAMVEMAQASKPSAQTSLLQPENERPEGSSQPDSEELVIKAVFKALNKQIRFEDANESDLRAAQSTALDSAESLKERQEAAWDLATMGDAEAIGVLKDLLVDSQTPTALKATILEGLGYSYEPQAKELLLAGINDENDSVVRAGIRGLGVLGDADSILVLSDILISPDVSDSVVQEAATALGGIEDGQAYDVLVNTYSDDAATIQRANLKEDVIRALGQRDISETADFLQRIIDENPVGEPLRVAAVEAVEDAQGDKSAFLVNNLHDQDSQVRAAVAWAFAVDEEPAQVADVLGEMLVSEQDAEVRKRLYQALGNQETADIESLAGSILSEPDSDARLAGYDLLAQQVQQTESAEFIQQFDEIVVPQLKETAMTAERLNQRLSAVISLRRAGTDEAVRALEEISAESFDTRVVEAAGI